MNTASNVKKALNMKIINGASEILPTISASELVKNSNGSNFISVKSKFNIQPYVSTTQRVPIAKRKSITEMLVSEWIDPSSFIDIAPAESSFETLPETSSPMAVDIGTQSALFNIAVIEEDERIVKMRHRLRAIQQTLPNALGPLKIDFINVKVEKEPAILPSPIKDENKLFKDSSPQLVSLPPIFNHPI